MMCAVEETTYNVGICSCVEVPAMTSTPLEDWNRCSDRHHYNDSYLHEPYFPKHFETEHLSTAIFGGSSPFPASLVH